MLTIAPEVTEDRLRALPRALDSGGGNGYLYIYTNPAPSTAGGEVPTESVLLCGVALPYPSVTTYANNVLSLTPSSTPVMATVTGECAWARFTTHQGLWVADMDIGLIGSGATLELHNGQSPPSLMLYAGGNFLLSAMQFTE